jgi:hypothetical protein
MGYGRLWVSTSKPILRGFVEATIEEIEGSNKKMEYRAPVLIIEAKHEG